MGNWEANAYTPQSEFQQLRLMHCKTSFAFHYAFFFPPFLIGISKGRTLSWSEDSCGERGRKENNQSPVPKQRSLRTPNKTHLY